jgi:hypothetical protein
MEDEPKILVAADPSSPALSNSAVARCTLAWEKAFREAAEEDGCLGKPLDDASDAFRAAMPPLTSRDNCRDFVACVAQGMLLGVFSDKNSTKLLYAVQIALSAFGPQEKSQGAAGRAVYVNLSESEPRRVKKALPQRSRK